MSWSRISRAEFDKIIPVTPPVVNRKMNPRAHNIGVEYFILVPCIVANQLNTLIPVGTAIIMVAAVKYARVSTSIPTVNMWCAQTIKPRIAIPSIA